MTKLNKICRFAIPKTDLYDNLQLHHLELGVLHSSGWSPVDLQEGSFLRQDWPRTSSLYSGCHNRKHRHPSGRHGHDSGDSVKRHGSACDTHDAFRVHIQIQGSKGTAESPSHRSGSSSHGSHRRLPHLRKEYRGRHEDRRNADRSLHRRHNQPGSLEDNARRKERDLHPYQLI